MEMYGLRVQLMQRSPLRGRKEIVTPMSYSIRGRYSPTPARVLFISATPVTLKSETKGLYEDAVYANFRGSDELTMRLMYSVREGTKVRAATRVNSQRSVLRSNADCFLDVLVLMDLGFADPNT